MAHNQSQDIYQVLPVAETGEDVANYPFSKKTQTIVRLNEQRPSVRNTAAISKPGMQVIRIITLN